MEARFEALTPLEALTVTIAEYAQTSRCGTCNVLLGSPSFSLYRVGWGLRSVWGLLFLVYTETCGFLGSPLTCERVGRCYP